MPFFNNTNFQAKRKFRFTVNFKGLADDNAGEMTFMVKTVSKPSWQMESTQHRFLNHEFKFPSIVKWQDINLTLIDAVEPNVGSKLYNALRNMGYIQPTSSTNGFRGGVTKASAHAALGEVEIRQLSGGGTELSVITAEAGSSEDPAIIDVWTLKNAFIQQVKFGDLAYEQDDLVQIDMTLRYDFATFALDGGNYGV